MNDAGFVEGAESGEDAKNNLRGFVRAAADAESEGFAFDELHDENEMILFFGDVVKPAGIGMSHLGGSTRFLPETLVARRVGTGIGDDFECDDAIEALIEAFIDDAHTSLAEFGQDLVRSDGLGDFRHERRFRHVN
jgi:hypothetical protein